MAGRIYFLESFPIPMKTSASMTTAMPSRTIAAATYVCPDLDRDGSSKYVRSSTVGRYSKRVLRIVCLSCSKSLGDTGRGEVAVPMIRYESLPGIGNADVLHCECLGSRVPNCDQ